MAAALQWNVHYLHLQECMITWQHETIASGWLLQTPHNCQNITAALAINGIQHSTMFDPVQHTNRSNNWSQLLSHTNLNTMLSSQFGFMVNIGKTDRPSSTEMQTKHNMAYSLHQKQFSILWQTSFSQLIVLWQVYWRILGWKEIKNNLYTFFRNFVYYKNRVDITVKFNYNLHQIKNC